MCLSAGMQSFTAGYNCNQSMDKECLPIGLQRFTLGYKFDQGMEKLTLLATRRRAGPAGH